MTKFVLLSITSFVICCSTLKGQDYLEPQWKFYFAFEDATNAKDTLWVVMDSEATFWNSWVPPYTNGWDPQFGEIPVELNEGTFNVWTYNYEEPYNPNAAKFKLIAYPISFSPGALIYANNYTLPITLSWDTTLFNSPVLQSSVQGPICNPILGNEWLFFSENAWWLHHAFSMLFDTEIVLPEFWWGSQNHFPLGVSFERGHNCVLLSAEDTNMMDQLKLYPNPCVDFLVLNTEMIMDEIQVYNLQGKMVLKESKAVLKGTNHAIRLDVRALPPGMYMLHARDAQGRTGVKKFVKAH